MPVQETSTKECLSDTGEEASTLPFPGRFRDQATNLPFQNEFLNGVGSLVAADLNDLALETPVDDDSGQSLAQGGPAAPEERVGNNYLPVAGADFKAKLATRIASLGSALTPDQVLNRATAMSCGGCHDLSNGTNVGAATPWPSSLRFVHVDEQTQETSPVLGGQRFRISPALTNLFPGRRSQVATDFLATPPKTCATPKIPMPALLRTRPFRMPTPGARPLTQKDVTPVGNTMFLKRKNSLGGHQVH